MLWHLCIVHYQRLRRWDVCICNVITEIAPVHVYDSIKRHDVELRVTDPNGLIGRAFEKILVGRAPDAEILVPEEGSTFAVGDKFILKGQVENAGITMTLYICTKLFTRSCRLMTRFTCVQMFR